MKDLICGVTLLDIADVMEESENIIYLPKGCADKLMRFSSKHWIVRAISFGSFSDRTDTLVESDIPHRATSFSWIILRAENQF